jgi:hypothetical protein
LDIREEKQYIYRMMEDITAERRNLSEVYFDLKKRLDKLDELELRGLDQIGVEGYLDLYKRRDRQLSASNIRRELELLDKRKDREESPTPPLAPAATTTAPVNELVSNMKKAVEKIEESEKPEEKIPKKIIEEAKRKEQDKAGGNKQVDFQQATSAIRTVLKETGRPIAIPDLHKKVEEVMDRKLDLKNFRTNILFRAVKNDDKIVRAGRGFYQYKFGGASISVKEENSDYVETEG